MKRCIFILILSLLSGRAVSQNDSIPFLTASLMIGEPTDLYPQSVFGHAFIRLQCPSAGLDNCFSMESGNYEGFRDICLGNYPNRLVAIVTSDYLNSFNKEGRKVSEYPLNLTQREIQKLWKYLDEKASGGDSPYHDFFHHGCSQEIIRFLSDNLDGEIQYGERSQCYGNTLFSLGIQTLPESSWIRIPFTMLLCTDGTDNVIQDYEKTAVPYIIPDLFADAVIADSTDCVRPIFRDGEAVVYEPDTHFVIKRTTPVYVWVAALLVLVIVLSFFGIRFILVGRIIDITLFALYVLITVVLIAVSLMSSLQTTSGWNWNFLIYNPIPLLVWLYSKFRTTCLHKIYFIYAIWIILFLTAMYIIGNHYVLGQYLLALTFVVRCLFKSASLQNSNNKK